MTRRSIVLPARAVPLGGLRSMDVLRTLPHKGLPTIGAWCFIDRFGPQSTIMRVEPHPHMGLQTVTWPLAGRIRHRDSLGSDVILEPGALNLMTSGAGIAHSEYSLGEDPAPLDALQLWIALPNHARGGARGFERHESLPVLDLGPADDAAARGLGAPRGAEAPANAPRHAVATVVLGTLGTVTSPATTFSPLVGAQITIPAGASARVPLDPTWEHGLLLLTGDAAFVADDADTRAPVLNDLLYLGDEREAIHLASASGATLFLIGGEPLREELVMWWNFVGRSHEDITQAWDDWQAHSERFGEVAGHDGVRIPAPPMPMVRLTPRSRRL